MRVRERREVVVAIEREWRCLTANELCHVTPYRHAHGTPRGKTWQNVAKCGITWHNVAKRAKNASKTRALPKLTHQAPLYYRLARACCSFATG